MKITRFSVCLALAIACTASAVHADTLYWSGNGTTQGGVGTWDETLQRWGTVHTGPYTTVWDNTNLDTAVFGSTAGTVTLGVPITVGGLQFFSNSGYTIAAGASGLTFGAASNDVRMLNVTGTTSAATISGTVGGSGNVTLTSVNPVVTSTLTLNSTGDGWSGATTVEAGATLVIGQTSTALMNTSAISINGGMIRLDRVNDAIAGNQISNTAPITFNGGGTIQLRHVSAISSKTENVGAVTIASGQANFDLSNGTSSGGNSFVLSSLTRSVNTAAVTYAYNANILFKVNGEANTAAGEIIGPWATIGTNASAQTDYAVYTSGDGTLAAANIGASAETDWTTATNAYTLNGGTTLTGTRTIAALRYTGAADTLALDTFNLETSGLLNGGSGLLTVSGAGGSLTTASGGGQLHVTPGSTTNNITVSAPITNNSGAVTLVKNGAGTLTLSNTGNSYTGGTVLNAGTLAIGNVGHIGGSSANLTFNGSATLSQSAALNFSGGTLTVNEGANAVITSTNGSTTFATTTGTGNLIYQASSSTRNFNLGNASGFTGNLEARLTGNANYALNTTIQFSSLGDGVGSALQFVGGTSDSNQAMTVVLSGGSAPLVFNNRQIQTLPRNAGNHSPRYAGISNNNANAANTWVINTDLDWGFNTNGSSPMVRRPTRSSVSAAATPVTTPSTVC